MSHWTEIKTQVRDLNAARAACRELGVSLEVAPTGQKVTARGYYQATTACDAVIRLAGPYDVALNRQPDGTYSVKADYYAGHVAKQLGPQCKKFTQLYGVHAAIAAAPRGAIVNRIAGPKGSILVRLSVV